MIILSLIIGIYFVSKPNDNKKSETQTEQKVDVSKESDNKKEEKENSKTDKNTDNSNSTSTTKDNNNSSTDSNKKDSSNSGNSSSNSGSFSNTGNSGGSDKPSKPAHQHSWKQHTAQKWVPNMVTVPDYEVQKVAVGTRYIFAYDGYTTTSDADAENHAMELVLAGVDDGYRMETIYEERQIQVGSHQEDHGHYETYVDYEYCDCGARR